MAVPSNIDFRDLNEMIEMHRVVSSPSSDTETDVWGRVFMSSDTAADLVIHDGWGFDLFTTNDWQLWYIDFAGYQWLFSSFELIHGTKLIKIRLETTSSLSTPSLSSLDTYDSDDLAAAGGVAVNGWYRAGSGHDRADFGSVTSRLV